MINGKKNTTLKNKFINHLVVKGKKNKSEIIILKSFKTLQINSKKASKRLFQLALIFNTPIFKINIIEKKKRKKQKAKIIPAFIFNKKSRISHAIKLIINTTKNNNNSIFHELTNKILISSQNKEVEIKKKNQNQIFSKRHLFKYYRWH